MTRKFLMTVWNAVSAAHAGHPSERLRTVMFRLFWLYIVIFAVGPGVREVLPTMCLLCLIPYYFCRYRDSTLRRFTARPLFIFFFLAAAVGVLFSQDVQTSFLHVGRGVNKAFILPFVAMECVRNEKDLRRLIWAVAIACLWQGCNGIWQSISGFDFIDHTPTHRTVLYPMPSSPDFDLSTYAPIVFGRLTGSLSDYRVGNYMALMLIPAGAVWFILRERFSRARSLGISALLLGPGLYLLYFSYTRNAYLTIVAGAALWLLIRGNTPLWKPPLFAGAALLIMICLMPRLRMEWIPLDGRWELWRFAWAVFREFPLTGAGFGRYNAAFRQLGCLPTADEVTISHPHNIYLQLLCESGILGFVPAVIFLFGMLAWGYMRIRPHLRAELRDVKAGCSNGAHWRITALMWCVWGAYLASGVFGHDFFRIWWQALIMGHLGIMIGAIVNAPPVHPSTPGPAPSDRGPPRHHLSG
jgi:O-antigen ligase